MQRPSAYSRLANDAHKDDSRWEVELGCRGTNVSLRYIVSHASPSGNW
jgi:hypothetical protein